MSKIELYDDVLTRAVTALASFLYSGVSCKLEVGRVARVLYVLAESGCSTRNPTFYRARDYVTSCQQPDGGWSDPEETAWAMGAIRLVGGLGDTVIPSAMQWLDRVRHPGGGWGRHPRDRARIPITSLISAIASQAVKPEDRDWLIKEWQRDFEGPVRLSYKAGFFLLAMPEGQEKEIVAVTISHLLDDQNDDGGFAPWKGHPIGSDPWSTGIVLLGLLSCDELSDRKVIEKAVNWLAETQLPNGLWPYHYIDEGSAYAYWGLVEALKYLSREQG